MATGPRFRQDWAMATADLEVQVVEWIAEHADVFRAL